MLTDRSRAQLQELLDEQAALRRVATSVARDAEPAQVFRKVCTEVGAILGVQSTNLARFEGPDTAKVVGGWSVNGAPVFPVGHEVPLDGEAAVAKVRRSGRPERVDDYTGLKGELVQRLRRVGIASSVAAPITVAGKLWGAVVASSGLPRAFPPNAEDRVAAFAELVADALASADAREQLAASRARIVEAGDAERRRLERNLHDGAQQRLVSLALDLSLAEAKLAEDPATAERLLRSARDELNLALEELRELARGLHPAILTERGLGPALEALVKRAPVNARLGPLPADALPQPVEAAVYYVVAEALANVAKHARASEVTVRVTRSNGLARVVIADDGIGGAEVGNGSGLRGLADRIDALGGHLDVDSPPGEGTTLTGEIPV